MLQSIFDIIFGLFDASLHVFVGLLGALWDLFTWSADLAFRFLGAVGDLLLRPFTQGFDRLWDWGTGAFSLAGALGGLLSLLLGSCLLIALAVAAGNAYRRFRR